jgi:hypothetical protein
MNEDLLAHGLRRLREGLGLAAPTSVLGLNAEFKRIGLRVLGVDNPSDVEMTKVGVDLIRAAVLLLPEPLQRIAAAEFGLSAIDEADNLTDRRENVAAALGQSSKTISRKGLRAVDLMCHYLRGGEAEKRLAQGHLALEESSVAAPESDTSSIVAGFWGGPRVGRIDVLCSEIPVEERPYFADPADRNYLRYAKFADLDTLIYLRSQLARYLPTATIRDFSPTEYFDTDTDLLVTIGGSAWNDRFRDLQDQLPVHFQEMPLGQDDPLVERDLRHYPEWRGGSLVSDVSLFTRLTLSSGARIHMVAGCLTAGVLGAARCFLDPAIAVENIEWINDRVGSSDFVVAFRTLRVGSLLDPPQLRISGVLLLYARDRSGAFLPV